MEKICVAVRVRPRISDDSFFGNFWKVEENRVSLHKVHGTPISAYSYAFGISSYPSSSFFEFDPRAVYIFQFPSIFTLVLFLQIIYSTKVAQMLVSTTSSQRTLFMLLWKDSTVCFALSLTVTMYIDKIRRSCFNF